MSRRETGEWLAVTAGFLALAVLCILLTGQSLIGSDQAYNSYSLQAQSWLDGRLDLKDGARYPWLELAIRDGKYYVSFPPFPSILLLPLVLIFGVNTPDTLVALASAALACFHAVRLAQLMLPEKRRVLFWTLALLVCNGYLFLCQNGWVWFIAQNLCFTLSLASLHHAAKGRGGWCLTCWAMAVGCRPMAAVFGPFLLWHLWKGLREKHPEERPGPLLRRHLRWAIGPVYFALIYMALNLARFGNPLEFGHNYLPEFEQYGAQFSPAYIVPNLVTLLRPPALENGMLTFQTVEGGSCWLLNPFLLLGTAAWLCGCRQDRGGASLWLLPLSCLCYLLMLLLHRTLGGWQFGNRYLVDLMPWIFFGILLHHPRGEKGGFRLAAAAAPYCLLAGALQIFGAIAAYRYWF